MKATDDAVRFTRCSFWLLAFLLSNPGAHTADPPKSDSNMRPKVTVENWDKGGPVSHWVYTHAGEMFPSAIVRRGGTIVDLPEQLRPEIGDLKLTEDDGTTRTLQQLIDNGAVDGCIVLHAGRIAYEKYPRMQPNDLHLLFSVSKAFVGTTLAMLENQGRVDLEKPVESFLPELEKSAWAGTRLRDIADMRSGMEGNEMVNNAYRDPAQKQYQLEATLGWQVRSGLTVPGGVAEFIRQGDLVGFLGTLKREHKPGDTWAYVSSNTAVLGEVIARVTGKSLANTISEKIWSRIGAEHDALWLENERGFPIAHAGMVATLRDVARFGLLFTKNVAPGQRELVSEKMLQRILHGRSDVADEHGMLPLTYQWDMVTDKGELAKGGWAGQLLYVNREKDVVVVWAGTNQTADPKLEPMPCRIIAKTFF